MTLQLSHRRAKRRWLVLGTTIVAFSLAFAAVAQAAIDNTLFELDRDGTTDTTYTKMGVLNAAIASSTSPTSVQICQDVAQPAYNGKTVLVDAEQMTLGNGTAAGGGGCPTGFTQKTNYTAQRAQNGTSAGAHSKGENVSVITSPPVSPFSSSHDWDEVYNAVLDPGGDPKCASLDAIECTFVQDGRGESIFTQSKDYDEINTGWQWRDQSVPDANELDDGFAIKYVTGSGATERQYLFFGADRFATEGTKDAGFWFFKNPEVGPVDPVGGADGTFNGTHVAPVDVGNDGFCNPDEGGEGGPSDTPDCDKYDDNDTGGDVLILTTFTGGGAVTTIRVFEWIGPAGTTDALLERGTQGDCVAGSTTQDVCAIVNNTTVETAWPYDGKNEPVDDEISAGGFLEGGIDLTAFGLEGCFSGFMATTRSSASLTADPKDFIFGSFEACGATVVTTPKTGAGGTIPDGGLQLGTGLTGVTAQDSALLTVTGTSSFTGSLDFFICGPIANDALCTTGGVPAGTVTGITANGTYNSDVVKLTSAANNSTGAPGRYCWRAVFSSTTPGLTAGASDATAGECFYVKPVTPTLTTTAVNCTTQVAMPTVDFPGPFCDKANLTNTANKPATNGTTAAYPSILTGNPLPASNGAAATGTITFTLFGPDATPQTGCPGQTTVATGTNPQNATVSGNGDYFTTGVTVSSPGKYHWKASYGGDNPNTLGVSHNDLCNQAAEEVTVNQIPTVTTTRQFVFPQDKVKIDSTPTGATLSGNVTFRLFEATGGADPKTALQNCLADDGTATAQGRVYNEGPISVSGTAPQFKTTNNTSYRITDGRTYVWRVIYASSTTAQLGSTSNCVENVAVTFGGDDSNIAIP
jgi:hypothetical protein